MRGTSVVALMRAPTLTALTTVATASGHQRAASAIVLSPRRAAVPAAATGSASASTRWDVLLLQRSATGTFRNALVFPGGKVDPADADTAEELLALARSAGPVGAARSALQAELGADLELVGEGKVKQELALRVAALRETFEETGLLLVPTARSDGLRFRALVPAECGYDARAWHALVEDVHSHPRKFGQLLLRAHLGTVQGQQQEEQQQQAEKIAVALMQSLPQYTRWWAPITPDGLGGPRRKFDTSFYIVRLEEAVRTGPAFQALDQAGQAESAGAATARPDGGELTAVHLLEAGEVLRRALRGEATLYPPQLYMLTDLAACEAEDRQPAPQDVPLVPVIVPHPESGAYMLLPHDGEYAKEAHANPGAGLARLAASWAGAGAPQEAGAPGEAQDPAEAAGPAESKDPGKAVRPGGRGASPRHRLHVSVTAQGFAPTGVERRGVPGCPAMLLAPPQAEEEREEGSKL